MQRLFILCFCCFLLIPCRLNATGVTLFICSVITEESHENVNNIGQCRDYTVDRRFLSNSSETIRASACRIEADNPDNQKYLVRSRTAGWLNWLCRDKKESEASTGAGRPFLTIALADDKDGAFGGEILSVSGGGSGSDFFDHKRRRPPGRYYAPFVLGMVSEGMLAADDIAYGVGLELPELPTDGLLSFQHVALSDGTDMLVITSGPWQGVYRRASLFGNWYRTGSINSRAIAAEGESGYSVAQALASALAQQETVPVYQLPVGGGGGGEADKSSGGQSAEQSGEKSSQSEETGSNSTDHQPPATPPGDSSAGGDDNNPENPNDENSAAADAKVCTCAHCSKSVDKTALQLPCGHFLCEECLEKVDPNKESSSCGKTHQVGMLAFVPKTLLMVKIRTDSETDAPPGLWVTGEPYSSSKTGVSVDEIVISTQRLRTLTTGRLHTEMAHVYEDIETITGEPGILTHCIPGAMDALESWLKSRVTDKRFWNNKYDPEHGGTVELKPMTSVEKSAFVKHYNDYRMIEEAENP